MSSVAKKLRQRKRIKKLKALKNRSIIHQPKIIHRPKVAPVKATEQPNKGIINFIKGLFKR